MDTRLLDAAVSGNVAVLNQLVRESPKILLGKTPLNNTALHFAVIYEHEQFAKELCLSSPPLLLATNSNGETPLHIAAMAGHHSMATFFIQVATQVLRSGGDIEGGDPLKQMMMTTDKKGNTALHHALRHGHSSLALELLQAEPKQSELIDSNHESPMYIAAYRGLADAVTALVQIPSSNHGGYYGHTALHAATISEHSGIVETLLRERPELAKAQNDHGTIALVHAAVGNKLEMLRLHLRFDPSLAYIMNQQFSAFHYAARLGYVRIAEELIRHCPDSGFLVDRQGRNALHLAIIEGQVDFVKYILKTPALHGLLNQPDDDGSAPLHLAAETCNPEILRALLAYERVDRAALKGRFSALDIFFDRVEPAKTLKWNEAYTLLLHATVPGLAVGDIWHTAEKRIAREAICQIQSLTQRYTQNTSLTAILIATVTFAAAFTMPGGFSSDEGPDEGLPILAKKAAFKAFLISDTIAMVASLAVSFLCIFAGWEDIDFLLHYRASTRKLLWCAIAAMSVAFASAMFAVLAPGNLWLAILISLPCCALPFLTYILAMWPLCKLRLRYGGTFRPDLLEQV
ncbi:protein ACCELERATED CELL DEATH 6-like isoform X1 [Phoenix dactylifera]|uniref:Protein ACCELERATED CELL DEATH 6-like isoform X1 n=1 Tax=Phoenix dactylifera TaxID=42345 RepID=A0A8B9ALB3_PHODC|nr:protein ACCELERATED CELL DEATH 6-like isoform X1 [Phoenix dactylifera]